MAKAKARTVIGVSSTHTRKVERVFRCVHGYTSPSWAHTFRWLTELAIAAANRSKEKVNGKEKR